MTDLVHPSTDRQPSMEEQGPHFTGEGGALENETAPAVGMLRL